MTPSSLFRDFFDAWHGLHSKVPDPASEMAAFFEAWQRIPPRQVPLPSAIDILQFQDFVQTFPAAYRQYLRSGITANPWRHAGIGRDEMRNSFVLRWLLDCFGDHGQGSSILAALLDGLKQDELVSLVLHKPYHTRVEQRLTDDGSSRADIAINGHDFTILIEVKIDAPESGDQIKRYLDHLAALPGGKRALIFLTPQGRPVKDEKLKGSVSYLSWSEVADVLDTHINREPGLARQPAGLLLSHFAEHIRGHARQRRKKQ